MAKRKVNKSQHIREFLAANTEVGPTEAAKQLSSQLGTKISPAFVSNIKGKMSEGSQNGKGKRGRRTGSHRGGSARAASYASSAGAITMIRAAQQFVEAAGGVANAKEILDVLGDAFHNG